MDRETGDLLWDQYAIRNTAENEPELSGGQLGDGAMWRLSANDRLGTHGRDQRQRDRGRQASRQYRSAGSRKPESGRGEAADEERSEAEIK